MRTSSCCAAYRFHAATWLLGAALLAASLARAAEAELLLAPAGTAAGDWLGLYVAAAGDLDGDGTPDFAVGAPRARGAAAGSGVVHVYLGGPALDAAPDLVLQGEAAFDQFGTAVAGCGDVNGDGWDDLVVGAPRHDGAAPNAGRAYVYFGGPGLDDQPDLLLDGPAENALFGYAVAGAGNMDGAGNGVIVGAPSAAAATGRAFVYFGGADLDSLPDLTLGAGVGGYFGWSVASAGDFDGDGWDDVMVGGNTLTNVHLFAGGPGVDDQADLLFQGDASSNRFGYGLAPAGDVNGDGWDDVVIGDMHNSAGAVYGGRAHVYFGGPGADGLAELAYTGTHERGIFGRTVAGAGDVNGDGLDDLLIGAPTPDTAGYGPGWAFVFFGGDTVGTSLPDSLADLAFTGEAPSDRLGSQVAVVPDLDGDGRAELLTGANLYDNGALLDAGRFYLHRVPNLAPVALADSVVLPDLQPVVVAVLANDGDPDGVLVPASVTVVAPPLHGLAEVDTLTGAIVYTPDLFFPGADSLAYTVRDHEGAVSAPATVLVSGPDLLPPAPVDLLAALGGHGAVALGWEGTPADADSLEIWRAVWRDGDGRSAYPLYDDAPGSAPPLRPADRAAALADTAWTLVARVPAAAAALVDSVAERGVYHYEIFARDAAGNWGAPTDAAPRALNYRLGDLAAFGDGAVDSLDAAALAAGYGGRRDLPGFAAAADVGPTGDGTLAGVPVTDGAVDFEDVMMLAMDYGAPAAPASAGGDVQLAWTRTGPQAWTLALTEAHPAWKGLRLAMTLPDQTSAQVVAGPLATAQAAPVFLAATDTGAVDVALAVLGGGEAFVGTGALLELNLAGTTVLPPVVVTARATDNTPLAVAVAGPPNDVPVAAADSVVLPDAQPAVIDVLANDSDLDGVLVPASVMVVVPPLHGLAEVDTLTGAITYTPAPAFAGLDSLAYTVADDGGAVSAPAVVLIEVPDVEGPAAVAQFAAVGGHAAVALGWEGVPADADSLEIWRAVWRDGDGQSAYPLYDDAPGSAPPLRPADRAAAMADTAWTLVARVPTAAAALVDSVAERGVYHYEIFARDAAGNWGAPTDAAPRALNYRLGDFDDQGDGLVDTADVAILALDYGLHRDKVGWDPTADVGPTDDRTATGIPVTDGEVDFEDAMIVAMNHGVPAAPASAGGEVRLAWRRPAPEVWVLHLEEAHASLKGLRVNLAVPIGVDAQVAGGSLAAAQAEPVFVANAAPDSIDAALVVLGGGAVFTGAGELLVITLSKPAELPAPTVTARAADNTDLATSFAQVSGVPGAPVVAFGLDQNSPNPFNPRTTIGFSLPEAGRTRLAVYDIRGRLVALLVDDDLAAGAHAVVWDGRDGRGARAGSGVYLYRLEARGQVTSRRMTLVK